MVLIALLVSLVAGPALSAQWNSAPCWIQDADASGDTVLLLCEENSVYVSGDGGNSWRETVLPESGRQRSIYATGQGKVFVVGDSGAVLVSDDGGRNWRRLSVPTTESLTDIAVADQKVWVVGHGGTILHSGDGGTNWFLQPSNTTSSLESVFFVDERHGWAVGWSGAIVRTTNGGALWEPVRSDVAKWSLNDVFFRDVNHGWAVGFLGEVLRTRDGGITWERQQVPVRNSLSSVVFDSSGQGWIAGESGVLVSEDGGESWQLEELGDWAFLNRILILDGRVWAVGPFGVWESSAKQPKWRELNLFPGET